MKNCDELNLPCPEKIDYFLVKNKETGLEKEVLSTEWNWQEDDFVTNTEKSIIIEGYEAPIKDFSISLNGADYTDSILISKNTLLVVAYNLEKTDDEAWKRIKELALASELEGITFATLTASTDEKIASFKQQMQIPFLFTLQTKQRSKLLFDQILVLYCLMKELL